MNSCSLVLLVSLGIVGQSKSEELKCGPGQFLDLELKECQKCPQGTFSSMTDQAVFCAKCSKSCFDNRNAFMLENCSSTRDMICQCKDGYYALSTRSLCKKHTRCDENCLKSPGSATSNTECYKPCPTAIPVTNLSVESSAASTVNFSLTGSAVDTVSYPLGMPTSSSNQTALNEFLQIGLPVLILVVIVSATVICCRKKISEKLKLQRAFRRNIYQILHRNRENQQLPVDAPPHLPPRNAALAGNDHIRTSQQLDECYRRTALIPFANEVPSAGNVERPLHQKALSHGSQQCETIAHVPNSHILPLEPQDGESSPQEAEALLHESLSENSVSLPSLHPDVVLPENVLGRARLPLGSADVQDDSATGHNSKDLHALSNSEDLRGSQTRLGFEGLRGFWPTPGSQNLSRTSVRPYARVQPLVRLPGLNREATAPQHPQVNDPQHIQLNDQPNLQPNYQPNLQPNYQPGVPNHIVFVENVYSIDSIGQSHEVT